MKQLFGEQGIPEKLVTDNGSQYTSAEFQRFTKEWDFVHTTSSPRYPQSNGFAERNVQTVKNILHKAKESHSDPYLALLCFRSTPIDHNLPSPAEMLYSRKPKTNLPSKIPNSLPDPRNIQKNLERRQTSQKKYHDRHAHDLAALQKGQHILMKKEEQGRWIPATVLNEASEPRSYMVQTPNGTMYRRNRRHLLQINPPRRTLIRWADDEDNADQDSGTPAAVPPATTEAPGPGHEDHGTENHQQQIINSKPPHTHTFNKYTTRTGRIVKRPNRMDL